MDILILGSGYMANEYLKVLSNTKFKVLVIGRSEKKIDDLKKNYPNVFFFSGGIQNFLMSGEKLPEICFNCVSIENLFETTISLINNNVKKILVEKPGSLNVEHLKSMQKAALDFDADVYIGYNRHFYSSVQKLKECCYNDGGITSLNFEFTEWIHTINEKDYSKESLQKWMMSNSSHVIDLVFHLIDYPKDLYCIQGGKDNISWHKSGSIFVGCGISNQNIPFSYHSNWESSGRWSIEISTYIGRYLLMPMEILQFKKKGTINYIEIEIDDKLDKDFKHGVFNQINSFLNNEFKNLVSLEDQIKNIIYINKIAGYLD